MAWNTAICQTCCTPPKVALNASEVFRNTRDLSQYIYTSTIQGQTGKPYQFKSQTERLQTLMGRVNNPQAIAFRRDGGVGCQCANVGSVTGISLSYTYEDPNYITTITWNAVPGASSYTFTTDYSNSSVVVSGTTATITSPDANPEFNVTITAINACSSSAITQLLTDGPCFLAGSLVTLGDGSTKAIEDVLVGDIVLGAFGELNEILALHRPLLGEATMCKLNDEHSTTSHHPHISIDGKFYCNDPTTTDERTYGRTHNVQDNDGVVTPRFLHGLKKGRVQQLHVGIDLKTTDGSRVVKTLETYTMPPETQLYNLVVGGSHTYHVDGYAVTGWPREDDFDYDAWKPISVTN
jgi:hypothetical protein